MKNVYNCLVFSLFVVGILLTSCTDLRFDIDSQSTIPPNLQTDVLDKYIVEANNPETIVFQINSNTPWSAKSDQQWCTVSPTMSGSSSLVAQIAVTCEANIGSRREANVTITAVDANYTKVVKIVQVSKEELLVIPYDELVPSEGGTITFEIVSNKAFKITPSTQFISQITPDSGSDSDNTDRIPISIKIPANPGAKRSGTITVKTDFETYSFDITQNGINIVPVETPENGIFTFNGLGETKEIEIAASQDWKVKVPEEYQGWISAEKKGDNILVLTTKLSTALFPRSASVVLQTAVPVEGYDGSPLKLSQDIALFLPGDGNGVEYNREAGTIKVAKTGRNYKSRFTMRQEAKITFEFEEIHFTSNTGPTLIFNFYPDNESNNTNSHLWIGGAKTSQLRLAGKDFGWAETQKTLTLEEINAIKKIEMIYQINSSGGTDLTVRLNGEFWQTISSAGTPFDDPEAHNFVGLPVHIQHAGFGDGDYVIMKGVNFEPLN